MTEQSKIRYGVIGCGMMGQEHIRNIKLMENTAITAIFEPDDAMLKTVSELASDAALYSSLDEILDCNNVDAWLIASPNHIHYEQLEKIARHNPKPILVEKPVCTNSEQLEKLEKFWLNYPCPVWVAMEYRYMPVIAAILKEARNLENVGELISVSIREHRYPFLKKVNNWNRFNRYTGGTLVEKCCHFFDLMRLMIPSNPISIFASGGMDVNHKNENYNGNTPDIIDNAMVIVNFENGQRALLELAMFAEGSRYQEAITAVGNKGKVECYVPGPQRFWKGSTPPPLAKLVISPRNVANYSEVTVPVDETILEAGDHNGSTYYQHLKFAQVVRGTGNVEVSLHDGMMAVKMGLAAQESIQKNMVVFL